MSTQIPRLAGLTLLLDAIRAVFAHVECGWGGHEWFLVGDGSSICRCCLAERKG